MNVDVPLRGSLVLKARRGGRGRPFLEHLDQLDLWHLKQRWMRKVRRIDRAGDAYEETVTDPTTGEVVRSTRERLSEHRGHGSARERGSAKPAPVGER